MTTKTRSYKLLLIGCGDIGSRHLQAAAALKELRTIEVFDIREESLTLGKKRLSDVSWGNPNLHPLWTNTLEHLTLTGDLCIISTQAPGRLELVEKAVSLGYKRFLIEKVVTQSVGEYNSLLRLVDREGLKIWINCKTRAYPFHQALQKKVSSDAPIDFNVVGGQHGLATNGIHSADLFAFYDQCQTINLQYAKVDSELIPSKRNKTLFDLSGTIIGISNKGSRFTLSLTSGSNAAPTYLVSSPTCRFFLDQWSRTAFTSEASAGWQWVPAPFRRKSRY